MLKADDALLRIGLFYFRRSGIDIHVKKFYYYHKFILSHLHIYFMYAFNNT